jgi:S1-C subfamily serine protease
VKKRDHAASGLCATALALAVATGAPAAAADTQPTVDRTLPRVAPPQPIPAPPDAGGALRPAPVQLEAPPACEPGWATRVYKDARASVVRIDNAEGLGTGFIVFSPRYVATAFHVVALGRPLTITAADGTRQSARVVSTDAEHDLALLELEHPIRGAAPLIAETAPAPVGTPVVAIGHPFALLDRVNKSLDGLLYWTATQGIISERSDEFVQTDAAVNPGNSGGPLLACDGRVLGLVTAKLGGEAIGFAVPMPRVEALLAGIGKQPAYSGRWAPDGLIGGALQIDTSYTWLGAELGFGVVAYDRWATQLRGGLLWATSTPDTSPSSPTAPANGGPVLSSQGFRILGELDETYRALLFDRPFSTYFLFGVGVAGTIDRLTQSTLGQTPVTPGCTPLDSLACQKIIVVPTHQTNRRLWPLVTAGFLLGGSLEVTYAFQVNVDTVADSEHRVLVAVPF